MRSSTFTTPSSISSPAPRRATQVGFLSEREDQRVGRQLLDLAGRLREAVLVELHLLQHELASSACLIVESHFIIMPSSSASSTSKSCAGIRSRVRR